MALAPRHAQRLCAPTVRLRGRCAEALGSTHPRDEHAVSPLRRASGPTAGACRVLCYRGGHPGTLRLRSCPGAGAEACRSSGDNGAAGAHDHNFQACRYPHKRRCPRARRGFGRLCRFPQRCGFRRRRSCSSLQTKTATTPARNSPTRGRGDRVPPLGLDCRRTTAPRCDAYARVRGRASDPPQRAERGCPVVVVPLAARAAGRAAAAPRRDGTRSDAA